jgi:hypothetical protein
MTKSVTVNKQFLSLPRLIIVKLIWCTMALTVSYIVLQVFNCTHPCCLVKHTVENVVWLTGILFLFYQPTSFSCLDSSTLKWLFKTKASVIKARCKSWSDGENLYQYRSYIIFFLIIAVLKFRWKTYPHHYCISGHNCADHLRLITAHYETFNLHYKFLHGIKWPYNKIKECRVKCAIMTHPNFFETKKWDT